MYDRRVSGYKVWRHCLSSCDLCLMRCWARCRPLVISGIAFMVLCALRVWRLTVLSCTLLSPDVIALRECKWRHASRDVWAMFFFQWISLLWCRDLQAELSEQVDGRDSTSTDFSGRGKSRKRDVLAMCFAIHRRSNLLSDCEMHHEQHVRKCCCSKQFHVIRMWQQFSVWCQECSQNSKPCRKTGTTR